MKRGKVTSAKSKTKPQKVLLHMAKQNGDWAGKAISFDREEEYRFKSIEDLFSWLNKQHKQD